MAADTPYSDARRASWGEAGFLGLLFFGCLVLLAETFRFRSVPWDPLGMAFWPRVQLAILLSVIAARLWRLRTGTATDLGGFRRGIGILILCLGYVGAVVLFGIYLATPVFLLVFAVLRPAAGRRRAVVEALAASVAILLSVWLLFDLALGLRVLSLPMGLR